MTTEPKAKKNTDYSASAVKPVNPPEVKALLDQYITRQILIDELQAEMDKLIPDVLKKTMEDYREELNKTNTMLRTAIDEHGSYQNVEAGHYAVKQRKVSKSYDAAKFGGLYPQFKEAVIVPTVNVKALEGLIKGGLIKTDDPAMNEITTKTESYVYIIK